MITKRNKLPHTFSRNHSGISIANKSLFQREIWRTREKLRTHAYVCANLIIEICHAFKQQLEGEKVKKDEIKRKKKKHLDGLMTMLASLPLELLLFKNVHGSFNTDWSAMDFKWIS